MPPSETTSFNFEIEDEEIDELQHFLLECGEPLSTQRLALALLENRFQRERERLLAIQRDCIPYDPAGQYQTGDFLLFTAENNAIGEIIGERPGNNDEQGKFQVLQLKFEDGSVREYAAELAAAHPLNLNHHRSLFSHDVEDRAQTLLSAQSQRILPALRQRLLATGKLALGADAWFPNDLLLEITAGQLQLMEAVLQLNAGGPLTPEELLEQSGETAEEYHPLLIFSLNVALKADERFTEVGPAGFILWHLTRLLPQEARSPLPILRHSSRSLALHPDLDSDMVDCIRDLDDEWSDDAASAVSEAVTITLTYPHRRAGTLPLNASLREMFPNSRVNHCIWMKFVDGKDGETYSGWIIPEGRFVSGLASFYRKHEIPIGGYLLLQKTDTPTHLNIDFISYNERSESIRLVVPSENRLSFSEQRRQIGVAYDDLMIFGVDDLNGLDQVVTATRKMPLSQLLREIAGALSLLTPQGAIHFKTLYSAVNLLRRVPPAPLCNELITSNDFRTVGGNYWTLTR
ncbi:MAG: hypothetical protein OXF22_10390 [Anaerolineaceae bacterium]|nr:hypothetical protein [Anaerolineaceae bacterium]